MNETTRTLTFVGVAAVLAAAAFGMHAANQPPSLEEFSDVGEEFYPDFDNPRDATGLRVAAYNDEAARVDAFNVEFKNGLWRIPSHHDYPADGEERLAKTATSIIGLERGALVSTSAEDHKRLGVLNPLDDKVTGTEGRGDRITLTKGDTVLADYIVGTKVEDGPQNTWHVRRADENRTYRVTLDLDISTKFADWIEPDLLQFQQAQARELVIDRYSIDETRGVLVPGTRSELSRSSQDDPWKLEGIDAQTQQVKTSTVSQMLTALADLKIVGVRKKPAGLSANLRGEGEGGIDRGAVFDLEQKGFFIDSRGALVSNEGDFQLATADGARYVLRFGEVFTGSDVEIEVGQQSAETDDKPAGEADETADGGAEQPEEGAADEKTDAATPDEAEGEDAEAGSDTRRSRYVFITAEFDESLIAALPEQPVKPEPPADAQPKEADDGAAGDEKETDDAAAPADDAAAADDAAEEGAAESDAAAEKPDPQKQYEQALADYERQLDDWEAKQKEREAQIEAGQKRVEELNNRFADWYYVISAETFDKIRVAPEDLVEPLKKDDDAAAAPALPGAAPAPEAETPAEPAADADKPAEDKPADDNADAPTDKPAEPKPEADAANPQASAGDKPAAESTPADPAAEAPAASSEKPAEAPAEPDAADTPAADDAAGEES